MQQREECIPDADLAAVVAAWPTFPDHMHPALRALAGPVIGSSGETDRRTPPGERARGRTELVCDDGEGWPDVRN
jgi:hypothetical protein